ncbi:hypothetical protein [Mesonia aquimarina]|uniref:hypothetical protein n=1 Tax=Mesonia aquimarina TaxID=1504967 RepID=UPI000EF56DFE|nr:hypothetical protein [Mesonia aquimarina]
MTLNLQPDFSKMLKALFIGLLALLLFACKSKQKTVTRKAETVSELEQKDIENQEITTETATFKELENTLIEREQKDTVSEQKTELEAKLTPIDTTKSSSATINGKTYTWQNANLVLSEKETETNAGSSERSRLNITKNTTEKKDKKQQKNSSDQSRKETDKSSSEMNKKKDTSGFNWWWLLLLAIPAAIYFIYKKRTSIYKKLLP